MKLKNNISYYLNLLRSIKIKRKIIIIESDDWGSIRMPSRNIYEILLKKGYPLNECHYNRNDSLESNEDLEALFELLTKFRDKNGNHPVITANFVVANPNFKKIKESDYEKYFYEPITDTLKKYPFHNRVYDLYMEGMSKKIFCPQFHGREHVNVFSWMDALKRGDKKVRQIFQYGMFTVHEKNNFMCRKEYLDAFGARNNEELKLLHQYLEKGVELFNRLFGFFPKSFIAPCYTWHEETELFLYNLGFQHIQAARIQRIPRSKGYKIKRLHTGKINQWGQIYSSRNVSFEPSYNQNIDWVDKALNEIKIAFLFKNPAIISSHRVNYMGSIHSDNRERNLKLLKNLLSEIQKQWPDVEFMDSQKFGRMIYKYNYDKFKNK